MKQGLRVPDGKKSQSLLRVQNATTIKCKRGSLVSSKSCETIERAGEQTHIFVCCFQEKRPRANDVFKLN